MPPRSTMVKSRSSDTVDGLGHKSKGLLTVSWAKLGLLE